MPFSVVFFQYALLFQHFVYASGFCIQLGQYIKEINKNSRFDQEKQQSQTADKPWHREEEPHNNHDTPVRQTKQSNQLSLPHQDDCKTIMDIK